MPSQMFNAIGGGSTGMMPRGQMPPEMLRAMRSDFRAFCHQNANADPEAMIADALKSGRVTQTQVTQARKMAVQFGRLFG